MKRRVVVTGIGCVTPIGNDVESMWQSVRNSESGIGAITHLDASNFPTKFAAEVKDYDFSSYVDEPERFEYTGRNIRYAIGAASQAVSDSGILGASNLDPAEFGVYLGAGEGQQDFLLFMNMIAQAQRDGEVDLATLDVVV